MKKVSGQEKETLGDLKWVRTATKFCSYIRCPWITLHVWTVTLTTQCTFFMSFSYSSRVLSGTPPFTCCLLMRCRKANPSMAHSFKLKSLLGFSLKDSGGQCPVLLQKIRMWHKSPGRTRMNGFHQVPSSCEVTHLFCPFALLYWVSFPHQTKTQGYSLAV